MAEEYGLLIIYAGRLGSCKEIRQFLAVMEDTYNNLYAFDIYVRRAQEIKENFPNSYRSKAQPNFRSLKPLKNIENLVFLEDRLQIVSVVIQSPGFWEFLGSLNALEVIRKYLSDRHEHRKDLEYREAMEHRKLELENQSLQTKVMKEQIDLLRNLGVPEEQIRQALAQHVTNPLNALNAFQDSNLINGASIRRTRDHDTQRW